MKTYKIEFTNLPETIEESRIGMIRTCSLLATILEDSDIDKSGKGMKNEWKQRIMKLLMQYGYSWPKGAHEANIIFGESYGVDWQ